MLFCSTSRQERRGRDPGPLATPVPDQLDENGHLIADWYQRDLTAMMDALKSEIAARG